MRTVNLHDNAGKYAARIGRAISSYMSRHLESIGIGAGQYMYLIALYAADGQSQQGLSDLIGVDKSATVGAINKLEALGYVERRPDGADRRYYRIHLTPAGWALKPQVEAVVAALQELMLKGIADEDRATLLRLLRQMAANLER